MDGVWDDWGEVERAADSRVAICMEPVHSVSSQPARGRSISDQGTPHKAHGC